MIRKIEVETFHGPVDEAPKEFVVRFFFAFQITPLVLWLRSDMDISEFLIAFLEFAGDMLSQTKVR